MVRPPEAVATPTLKAVMSPEVAHWYVKTRRTEANKVATGMIKLPCQITADTAPHRELFASSLGGCRHFLTLGARPLAAKYSIHASMARRSHLYVFLMLVAGDCPARAPTRGRPRLRRRLHWATHPVNDDHAKLVEDRQGARTGRISQKARRATAGRIRLDTPRQEGADKCPQSWTNPASGAATGTPTAGSAHSTPSRTRSTASSTCRNSKQTCSAASTMQHRPSPRPAPSEAPQQSSGNFQHKATQRTTPRLL